MDKSTFQNEKANAASHNEDETLGVPESHARQIVHSVISAFCERSSNGLDASKYAPKNIQKAHEVQHKKAAETQSKLLPKKAMRPSRGPTDAKYDVANFDDPSAFLAAMNSRVASGAAATPGTNGPEPTPSALESTTMSKGPATPKTPPQQPEPDEAGDFILVESPSKATRVVKVTGVHMDKGMAWLYRKGSENGRKVLKVFDTFVPDGPRTVSFLFDSVESTIDCVNSFKTGHSWRGCQIEYASESSM